MILVRKILRYNIVGNPKQHPAKIEVRMTLPLNPGCTFNECPAVAITRSLYVIQFNSLLDNYPFKTAFYEPP